MTTSCPNCSATSTGKFCPGCGASLLGAACAACGAALTPGARYCHRCGVPAGASRAPSTDQSSGSGVGNALPWAVAGIAVLAVIALAAGQRYGRASQDTGAATIPLGPAAQSAAPDISSMSPAERAERLYDRVMGAAERGRTDTVGFFMPMAVQAYQAIGDLNVDQRYDLGRLAEVGGDAPLASAQADSILRANPQHLLGLVLAARAARMRNDNAAASRFLERLARAEQAERRKQLPEYLLHQNDIDTALAEWRQRSSR